jgi:hypothetical protein
MEVAMSKVTDVMIGYALRLALILVVGWLLVELVYSFHYPKAGDQKEEAHRAPLPSATP